MPVVNRVDRDKFGAVIEEARKNPNSRMKSVQLEGEWRLKAESGPQFEARLKYEKGELLVQSDEPSFLGGGGTAPNPVQYCIYGAVSCFAATLAKWAAMEGIVLRGLRVKATAEMDMGRNYGLSDDPILKGLRFDVTVDTDAGDDKLRFLQRIAEERCPAYWCLTNPIIPAIYVARG